MKTLIAAGLLALAVPAVAQDRAATTFYIASATTDIGTTWHNMQHGWPETDPLYHFTRDQPVGTMISLAATDALTLWLAHRYTPTHPKLVKVTLFALGGIRIAQSVRNIHGWYVETHKPFDLGSH